MIVTEEELREAWRNGRGELPDFPPGTRFTPSAKDFLTAIGVKEIRANRGAGGIRVDEARAPIPGAGAEAKDRVELRAEEGKRLILTSVDVDGLVLARPQTVVIHPNVTVTDAARERLRNAGIRLVPFVEKRPDPTPPGSRDTAAPAAGAAPGPRVEDADELFLTAKKAILARLEGRADEALVEAVLKRVIASL